VLSKLIIKAEIIAIMLLSLVTISIPIQASTAELTATRIEIKPFDGRKNNKGDWVGAWIYLKNVKIDGRSIGKSTIGFEFAGNFPNKPINDIGFSSVRTFTDMPKSAADRTHPDLGYRTWFSGRSVREDAGKLYNRLNDKDKLILKGICGLISDDGFANDIVDRLEATKAYSFYDWVDNRYNKYFSQSGRHKELSRIGKTCNVRLGNTGNKFVTFKIGTSKNVNIASSSSSKIQKICGYPTNYTSNRRLNAGQLRDIQRGLARYGLYNGAIDGAFGRGTCAALKKFMDCQANDIKKLDDGLI